MLCFDLAGDTIDLDGTLEGSNAQRRDAGALCWKTIPDKVMSVGKAHFAALELSAALVTIGKMPFVCGSLNVKAGT